jgi:hypothetical protein
MDADPGEPRRQKCHRISGVLAVIGMQLTTACSGPSVLVHESEEDLQRELATLPPAATVPVELHFTFDVPDMVDAYNYDPKAIGYSVRLPLRAMFESTADAWSKLSSWSSGHPRKVLSASITLTRLWYTRIGRAAFMSRAALIFDTELAIAQPDGRSVARLTYTTDEVWSEWARLPGFSSDAAKLEIQHRQAAYRGIVELLDTVAALAREKCGADAEDC